MKERSILFSAPMVRALLAGAKTQTRRALKPQPERIRGLWHWTRSNTSWDDGVKPVLLLEWLCPYGVVGDRLWVKESFQLRADHDDKPPSQYAWKSGAWHEATGNGETPSGCGGGIGRLRSSIHMPRWASRIDLEITEVRVQRLQDITEDDAIAEGVDPIYGPGHLAHQPARDGYKYLWNEINGAGSWAANPWVWCLSFHRVRP